MALQTNTMSEAIAALKRGDAAIFPTETVYGLGLSIRHATSPQVLYDLKERDCGKPIAWLVSSVEDLDDYGCAVPDFAYILARTFWPGPLTLIVKASDAVPLAYRSAEGTIGLRMPNNQTALELIRGVGCPLATTSANISGFESSSSYEGIDPQLIRRVGTVVADSDDAQKSGLASTVLDCTHEHPVMMREGAVSVADIRALS